jgi:hypothetical protein
MQIQTKHDAGSSHWARIRCPARKRWWGIDGTFGLFGSIALLGPFCAQEKCPVTVEELLKANGLSLNANQATKTATVLEGLANHSSPTP